MASDQTLALGADADPAVDPLYAKPYVDVDEWRDAPVRHRYVHGGFEGTECRFSVYFPPKAQYEGRFFQPVAAISGNENSAPMAMFLAGSVPFAIDSGGYLVESNLGRRDMFVGDDPTITSYRASAAVARYSRVLAAEMYGPHRPYGYMFGGSGGAFKTISGMQSTTGVWDGAVPLVHGSPVSIPYVFTVQAHAMRILWDRFPQIVDAIEPGGSGDMYAGLNDEEREALAEVTRMGFPPRAWFNLQRIAFGYTGVFTTLVDQVVTGDPSYFDAFWQTPGYLGADPTPSLTAARIQKTAMISGLVMPDEARQMGIPLSMPASQKDSGVAFPAALRIEGLPEGKLQGASIIVKSGAAKGRVLYIVGAMGDLVMVGFGEQNFQAMAALRVGDEVSIDNSVYLAAQTYHRHQVPGPEYYVWDQFKDADGTPLYPQRPKPLELNAVNGGNMSGDFNGKMIVVQALMDEAAYPWQADWYRAKVKATLGDDFDDKYRLWFVDHAMHVDQKAGPNSARPVVTTRTVSYQGVIQQALRDVAAWAETGVAPPASTAYQVVEGQVEVAASARDRKGIQPVVVMTANGGARADVRVGESVQFSGVIESPPGAGPVVAAEWDFEGAGDYPVVSQVTPQTRVEVSATYAFSKPGTYFPALRASAQREGDPDTPFAKPQNLGRVRVVVS